MLPALAAPPDRRACRGNDGGNGGAQLGNGKLLEAAEADGFDVFLTVDRNVPYQQNLTGRTVRVRVLEAVDSRIPTLAPLIPLALVALATMPPRDMRRITLPLDPVAQDE